MLPERNGRSYAFIVARLELVVDTRLTAFAQLLQLPYIIYAKPVSAHVSDLPLEPLCHNEGWFSYIEFDFAKL